MLKEKISWKSEGTSIFGEIYLPAGSPAPFPAVVVCHGIPGRTKESGDPGYPALAERLAWEGFAAVIFNFRGTGPSGGNFDLLGWVRDLETGLEFLKERPQIDPARIYLMGFSAGGAVAIYTGAHRKEIAGLVACASPAEFGDLLTDRGLHEFLGYAREVGIIRDPDFPPSIFDWRQGFAEIAPVHWISAIRPRPILLLQGTADEVVAPRHARLLYEKAEGKAEIYEIEGAGHRLRLEEKAMARALKWLKEIAFSDRQSALG